MLRKFLLSSLATVGMIASAAAADLPAEKGPPVYAPPPPVFSWTGFYIGAIAGAVNEDPSFNTQIAAGSHLGAPGNLALVSNAGTFGTNRTGFLGGGEVGYNYQISQFVLGVEGDAEYISPSPGAFNSGVLNTGDTFTVNTSLRSNFFATARARAGIAFDRVLVFATGGAAFTNSHLQQAYTDTLDGPTTGNLSVATPTIGWTVGGGIEYAITNNWSVKAEYLYARFGGAAGSYTILAAGSGHTNTISTAVSADQLNIGRIGVNYKF
jgi:outer membrane immunogenic protein